MRGHSYLHSLALLALVVAGCTVTTGPDSAGSCSANSSVRCTPGAVGYSCAGGAAPDPSLVCSAGTPESGGSTAFCCAQAGATSLCQPSASVVCPAGSIGYACTGAEVPTDSDPSLTCGMGAPSSTGTDFCCAAAAAGADASSGATDDAASDAAADATSDATSPDDAGQGDASDAGACTAGASTGHAACDACLEAQCCSQLAACDVPDDAGVNDAGQSACEQLVRCVLDCNTGDPEAGVAPGNTADCETICSPPYSATEQQTAQAVLQCKNASCSSTCP